VTRCIERLFFAETSSCAAGLLLLGGDNETRSYEPVGCGEAKCGVEKMVRTPDEGDRWFDNAVMAESTDDPDETMNIDKVYRF
jgi:hypothetical protein